MRASRRSEGSVSREVRVSREVEVKKVSEGEVEVRILNVKLGEV